MKEVLTALMLAAMILSTGCGNNAMDGAKKDAEEAAQKVEQTANDVKDAANAKVDEAKDAANQAADDAAAKVDEMKSDAENIAKDAADKADSMANDVKDALAAEGRTIALNGVMPGASVDDLTAMFGEATSVEGNVMTFVDGLKVTLDDATKTVKEISTTSNAFDTPEGIYVGADEYLLNDYCGPADATRKIDGGAEYEYNGGDKKSKVIYKTQNGVITEITCSLK